MKTLMIILVAFYTSLSWSVTLTDKVKIEEIAKEVILKNQKVENTGLGISVFNSKEVVLQRGFGFRDRANKKEVTAHTSFAIASTTKAFTSLGIKLLENRGQLKITDKVLNYLPTFKLSNEKITEQVTIEDILSHQVGLPRHDLTWLFGDFTREENFHRMQYFSFPEKAEENFRKKMVYNNFMYMTAGILIENVSGESYEDFVQKNILDRLNMKNTFLAVPYDYADLSIPYYREIAVSHEDIEDMAPAGSIYSNVSDMTKWIQSFMLKIWDNQDDLFKARIHLDDENPSLDYGYALGWMTNTKNKDVSWYFHNGALPGFSAMFLFSKELDLGIVILENQDGSDVGGKLVTEILKYELGKKPILKSEVFKRRNLSLHKVDESIMFAKKAIPEVKLNVKKFFDSGYGILESFETLEGKKFINYYGHNWELKPFHDFFNYVADLIFGATHIEFPVRIENDSIDAPFEPQVAPIQFKKMN